MMDLEQLSREDLERTAYHEAGHALFAAKHDMALDAVWVVPSDTDVPARESTWVGHMSRVSREMFEPYCLATDLGRAFVGAQLALAGRAAEAIVFEEAEEEEEARWAVFDDLEGTDLKTLTEALVALSPESDELRAPLAYMLVDLVCSFLVAKSAALDAIAGALLDSVTHSLEGPEVYRLVDETERAVPAEDAARSAVGS
ncbi:MAG: hypothetical protein ABFE07_26370 [Armatimonadia bacterium]